jgi:phosphoribosyl 1,2-cyclic phosphodiesterase
MADESQDAFRIRIWGSRGSVPVCGEAFRIFGGNTACVEMRCGDQVLIFDAGTGLVPAGRALKLEGATTAQLFLSHSHYDHIMGLPFFSMLYDPRAVVAIWSGHLAGKMTTSEMLGDFMQPPWLPIGPEVFKARVTTHDFNAGDKLRPHPDLVIKTAMLNHPGGAIGYRVEWGGRSVAILTDLEHTPGVLDPEVLALIKGCDLFLYDSTYFEEEMECYRGYGHSSWQHAILLAQEAKVGQVAFIHHEPCRTDAVLQNAEAQAKAMFSGAFFARDGQVIDL